MPSCQLSDGLEGVLEQFLRFAEGSRPLRKSSTLQQKICGYFSEICGLREVIQFRPLTEHFIVASAIVHRSEWTEWTDLSEVSEATHRQTQFRRLSK